MFERVPKAECEIIASITPLQCSKASRAPRKWPTKRKFPDSKNVSTKFGVLKAKCSDCAERRRFSSDFHRHSSTAVTQVLSDVICFQISRLLLQPKVVKIKLNTCRETRLESEWNCSQNISKLVNLKRRKQTRLETLLLSFSCDYLVRNLHCCLNLLSPPPIEWTCRMMELFCSM